MQEVEQEQADEPNAEFIEIDPTGRYGRYNEILGKGAFKTVYKAFDELEGIEVAWNQVKVIDVLRHCEDLERLYSEVHLLQTLKHKNIIKFYNSWVDTKHDNINFITEVFTSGTLRQYRKKHKHVDIRALKNWSRQILSGLVYLHSHDPPVIHRDLKCDNIFVNGNQGVLKIGDLGLAAILRHAHLAHSVIGTPEYMAPELYEEEYNELVDIYAFGMCLLELVTIEYPYVECTNAAQIYKKVTSGIKPASLGKVKDPTVRRFIEKCIANASERLSARELLMDPFLQSDLDNESMGSSSRSQVNCAGNVGHSNASIRNNTTGEVETPALSSRDFTVEGQRKDINTIFLKLRIADATGQVRNIHFPFDIEADTSISVATEMVAELDLTDQDVTAIAEMIDAEIQAHVPEWVRAQGLGNDMAGSDIHGAEAEDEVRALPNEPDHSPGTLVLERLPSGRRYWSDSPKGSCVGSPPAPAQSTHSSDLNSHASDDFSADGYEKLEDSVKPNDQMLNLITESGEDNQGSVISSASPKSVGVASIHKEASSDPMLAHNQKEATLDKDVVEHERLAETSMVSKTEALESVARKLEKLFVEQQNEFEELKRKHCMAIAQLLQNVPPELRVRVFNMCRKKYPDYYLDRSGHE